MHGMQRQLTRLLPGRFKRHLLRMIITLSLRLGVSAKLSSISQYLPLPQNQRYEHNS